MEAAYYSEISVTNYQITWHYIPEDSNIQSQPREFKISYSTLSTWQDQEIHFWTESIPEADYITSRDRMMVRMTTSRVYIPLAIVHVL
jgi:hypothetical protein